jgi:hypothetical protein
MDVHICKEKSRTNVILCVEFVANWFKYILNLNLNMNHVSVQVDKGWYFAFNVEKWIIVVALGSPTHELQALVKLRVGNCLLWWQIGKLKGHYFCPLINN